METCHGMTSTGTRCSNDSTCIAVLHGVNIPSCSTCKDDNMIINWSDDLDNAPTRIQNYISFFSHCLWVLKIPYMMSYILSSELYHIASLYYPKSMLMDIFYDIVFKNIKSRQDCPICYEKVKDPIMTRCKHVYCKNCIQNWVYEKGTCPLCRKLISQY